MRSGARIAPAEADGRIAQLRAQAKAAKAANMEPTAKTGEAPPEEYTEVQLTEMEDGLREITLGPDEEWLEDAHQSQAKWKASGPAKHPEAIARMAALKRVEEQGFFLAVKDASEHLQSHVRARKNQVEVEGEQLTLEEILVFAIDKGCRSLAEEAETFLDGPPEKVGLLGGEPDVRISQATWSADRSTGDGSFCFNTGGVEYQWRFRDFRDKLSVHEEIADMLGVPPESEEDRQCLSMHVAGAKKWADDGYGAAPEWEEVKPAAQTLRKELWNEAVEAHACLGDAPPWIQAAESDIRAHAHDVLRPHHDKDYRVFQVFPPQSLAGSILQLWRVSHMMRLEIDHLAGVNAQSSSALLPLLIHKNHMRLILPNSREELRRATASLMLEGKVMKDLIAYGWREHLLLAPEDAPMVPSKRPKCPRCTDPELDRVGSSFLQVPWSFQECSKEAQKAAVAEANLPLKFRPAFAYGLCVQEVFAGDRPWTQAYVRSGS